MKFVIFSSVQHLRFFSISFLLSLIFKDLMYILIKVGKLIILLLEEHSPNVNFKYQYFESCVY
jgi:hypothetical protein